MTTNAEHHRWLDLTVEDALLPGLPICDPHHHFWDRPNDRYFLDDLYSDLGGGHNIVSTIHRMPGDVPPRRPGGDEDPRPDRVRARASGPEQQRAVRRDQRRRRHRGFRRPGLGCPSRAGTRSPFSRHAAVPRGKAHHCLRRQPGCAPAPPFPEGLLGDAKFREGFAVLDKLGLSFDAYLYHPQLPEIADLANAFPGVTIILNHVGGPLGVGPYAGKQDQIFQEWKESMTAVAAPPNVVVKVGGLVMPVCGTDWRGRPMPVASGELAQATAPYYLHCIEEFGPERCMFESNFPVDKIACSYTVLWNAF